jgi:hypothetical protein
MEIAKSGRLPMLKHQFRDVAIISQFAFDEGVERDRVTRLV